MLRSLCVQIMVLDLLEFYRININYYIIRCYYNAFDESESLPQLFD